MVSKRILLDLKTSGRFWWAGREPVALCKRPLAEWQRVIEHVFTGRYSRATLSSGLPRSPVPIGTAERIS